MAVFSAVEITRLFDAVDNALTNDAKGAALEALGKYLFESAEGVECCGQNILEGPRAQELDLAFWIDQRVSELYFLDAFLIVECKATASRVSSREVGWFVRKLQDHGAHAQPSGMRYSMTKLEGVGNGNNQADSSRGRGDVPRSLGVHHITRRCGGKASAQDFCAGFHKLALLRRLESAQEIAFHVEDGYDLVAGHNRDRYLRFHQVRGLNITRVVGNVVRHYYPASGSGGAA